jgi:glycosyltransferase involved in cell wall biosynthesis
VARICVITAGHLSTCPRMLKAADALAAAGHEVRVVSARYMDWARKADMDVRRTRSALWNWTPVDCMPGEDPIAYLSTGVRFRSCQALARIFGPRCVPGVVAVRGYSRLHSELVQTALAEPADFYYGGTNGALAATTTAALRARVPYALDLEDFHTAEQEDSHQARLAHGLAERIERSVLSAAAFLTASSESIAKAYNDKYGLRPRTIHNVFPLPAEPPNTAPRSGSSLRLYWVSQTIGPGRGLEDVVRAAGVASLPCELHVRGRPIAGYLERLRRLTAETGAGLRIIHHEPAAPDTMVETCAGYDAGLALEQGQVQNSELCLSNKAFTYVLAGLAVVFTDTRGQRRIARDLGEGALVYTPGDIAALACGLKRWVDDRAALARARGAAWAAARRRWHWEHPEERGALLAAVEQALQRSHACAS